MVPTSLQEKATGAILHRSGVTMIGQKLGSFRVESKLGAGAMGVVYRAVNEATGRHAAVKVVTAELTQKGNAFERFKREAEILQQFRHPNIVRFLAVGRYKGTSYFAMEFVPGLTLDVLLEQRGLLPWQEVVTLGIQMCDALHYAHQHGVVHRDLKPSNLMVSDKGQIKLTDFGIAKDLDATALTATGRTLGTAAYMAPEQIRGTPEVSHKTDLYALGVVLYQMLTGEIPFQGPTAIVMMHRHLTDPAPRASAKLSEIPLELDDLVLRLMAKEPPDRLWDAAAAGMVLTELRDKKDRGEPIAMVWPGASGDRTMAATAAVKKPRKTGKAKRKSRPTGLESPWVQTGLLVTGLIALVGLAAYLLWPPSDAYLYRHAATMMASKDPTDWILARQDYLDELDGRYQGHPQDNPYEREVQGWRDRISLHQAVRRGAILEKPGLGGRGETETEKLFISVGREAADDLKAGRDGDAARRWREMAAHVEEHSPNDRGWVLLARQRAEELEKAIADRRERAAEMLDRADALAHAGRAPEAAGLREDVARRYAAFADLADLVARARAGLTPEPAPPEPAPPEPGKSESPGPLQDPGR
jgi:hypothetical protein